MVHVWVLTCAWLGRSVDDAGIYLEPPQLFPSESLAHGRLQLVWFQWGVFERGRAIQLLHFVAHLGPHLIVAIAVVHVQEVSHATPVNPVNRARGDQREEGDVGVVIVVNVHVHALESDIGPAVLVDRASPTPPRHGVEHPAPQLEGVLTP